ncbi:unnamed protein product, partial [Iphiclides podalirius]
MVPRFPLPLLTPSNYDSYSVSEEVTTIRWHSSQVNELNVEARRNVAKKRGDNYARDEFKRHKKCNPEEARIFLNEWTDYAIKLAKQMKPLQQAKKKEVGKYLDPKLLDYMTEDQLIQLYELHKAASLDPEQPTSTSSNNKH